MMSSIVATLRARSAALVGAAVVACLALPVAAQEPGSRQTRDFVQAAAQSDQFEIMEAHTALAQSTDPQVRAFAEQMIQAHEQTRSNLMHAAASVGLEPQKAGLGGDQSAFLAALQSRRGADFDRTYVRQQVLAHQSALAVEQAYASSGDNSTMKQAAALTVTIITSHLQMAEQLKASIGGA